MEYKVLPRKAVVLKGVRRSGKSTLLRQIEEDERASGRTCLHMNFIDERLGGLGARDLGEILQEYLDVLLLRDVIERHNASSPVTVKRFLVQLLTKFGSTFTINRCVELLKAQGLGTSKTNLSEMIEWFADAYAVFPVKMFSESIQKQNTNPKKIYAIGNGLINAVNTGRLGTEGRLLENLVFLTLRRQDQDIRYVKTRDGYEVDFYCKDAGLIQVAWSLDDDATRKRELRALEQAMEELHLRESVLITADRTETIELPSGTVRVTPAWEWSLGETISAVTFP